VQRVPSEADLGALDQLADTIAQKHRENGFVWHSNMTGLITSNMILYRKNFDVTVRSYKDQLNLPVLFSTSWFVEFRLTASSRLSIAHEKHTSVRSSGGLGITLALQVADIDATRLNMETTGLKPTPIIKHPWNARVFYIFDPEGYRMEIWQSTTSQKETDGVNLKAH
jgi:predicted enzyme related to lactoylglutathione lyase